MLEDIAIAEELLSWQELPRPILTVHIRHGKHRHESDYYPTEDYLQAVEIMKQRHGYRSVFLITDDRNASNTFETAIPNLGFEALVSIDAPKYETSGWVRFGKEETQRDAHLRIKAGHSNPCFEALSAMLNVYIGAKADGCKYSQRLDDDAVRYVHIMILTYFFPRFVSSCGDLQLKPGSYDRQAYVCSERCRASECVT